MCVEPFLTQNNGLVSLEPQEKHRYIEKFHMHLSLWPGFPLELDSLAPLATSARVWAVEKQSARFYTQTFFDNFSRPPVVLHLIPNPPRIIYPIGGR